MIGFLQKFCVYGDLSGKNCITIGPKNLISDVKKIIKEKNISGIPVVNENNVVLGIITNRDLRFSRNDKMKVKELMTKNVITIKQGCSSTDAKKYHIFTQKYKKVTYFYAKIQKVT